MSHLRPLLGLFIAACVTDTPRDQTPELACDNDVTEVFPEDGAANVYYRGTIEARLEHHDDTASITVTDEDGVTVEGAVTFGGSTDERIIFTPSTSLSPDTAYTATVSMCARDASWSFQTTSSCPPVTTDLVGRTYTLDLDSARVTEPAGVGPIITAMIEQSMLLGVVAEADDRLLVLGAFAEEDGRTQDLCLPTVDFPTASFAKDPYFQLGPQDVALRAGDLVVTVYDLALSGTFAADASSIDSAALSGEVDARDLAPVLWEAGTIEEDSPEAACALLAGFAVECLPCDRDGGPYCISVVADSMVADELPDITLEPVEVPDPADCP